MARQRVAVIGAGYWGPNLIRNFAASSRWQLVAVCDQDTQRARQVLAGRTEVDVVRGVDELLARGDVDAVAIATPAATHHPIAMAAISAGVHVLVEKPLASSLAAGREMVEAAQRAGVILMCDHTYCYTPAVRRIREMITAGDLGDIHFIDSVRINLGLVQPDVDVVWDLAPHDLSILDFLLPAGMNPPYVAAHGADPIGAGRACVAYLSMALPGGGIASIHVNWLSPTKIRRMVIGGSRRTLVWDDLNPQQRLSVYDRGVDLTTVASGDDLAERARAVVSYRLGDMFAPALEEREALASMVEAFGEAVETGTAPATDGRAGLRVLSVLDAASTSLRSAGLPTTLNHEGALA
ncbi:MAG: Gfo/Idh/MocA family protein [Actinomycetales bacterium]